MKTMHIAALVVATSSLALAGSWKDYKASFPLFPCTDGWTTCEVDGQTVSPDLVTDREGNPMPSNMRFSFWDFDALPGASPFAGLSDYDGDLGARELKSGGGTEAPEPVRSRDAIPEIPADGFDGIADPEPEPEDAEDYASDAPDDAYPVQTGADRSAGLDTPPAYEEPSEPPRYTPPSMDDLRQARENAAPQEPVPPVAVTPDPVPEPAPPEPDPVTEDAQASAELPPEPPPMAEPVNCDDLRGLETKAILGNLGVDNRKCLDGRLAGASKLTDKDKISRVLISDAKARGDKADWDRLMKRHLEQIDRSDPNMCLAYSISLHKRGVSKATQVIRWADFALENKSAWSGAAHTKNVYSLHQLKSLAASRLWQRAEKRFVKDRNEKNEAKATTYRSMAKQASRAWLDYAKASGRDTKKPLEACVSASGTTEFCPL